jgi:hypothetical protein
LSVVSIAQCTFIVLAPDNSQTSTMLVARGMFTEAYYEEGTLRGCLSYTSESNFKGAFMASRVFGVFTSFILAVSVVLASAMVLFVTRHHLRRMFLLIMRILNPFAFFFSAFMFSAFSADECSAPGISCKPGSAGIVAAVNTIVIFVVAVLAILVPGPKHSIFIPIWQVQDDSTGRIAAHTGKSPTTASRRSPTEEIQETALTRVN